jgi:hypothetical protein
MTERCPLKGQNFHLKKLAELAKHTLDQSRKVEHKKLFDFSLISNG